MSLRSFFLWFWGIVLASGLAGGTTLAWLHAPAKPAEPPPATQPVAMAEPLPVPPVPAIIEPEAPPATASKPHAHTARARSGEARRFAQLEPRITVVPPIPPARGASSAVTESMARVTRLPALRSPARSEPREAYEPHPRAYAYARSYPRYSYYSYSYYPDTYYPYPYYYSYSY